MEPGRDGVAINEVHRHHDLFVPLEVPRRLERSLRRIPFSLARKLVTVARPELDPVQRYLEVDVPGVAFLGGRAVDQLEGLLPRVHALEDAPPRHVLSGDVRVEPPAGAAAVRVATVRVAAGSFTVSVRVGGRRALRAMGPSRLRVVAVSLQERRGWV